jgi:preprotein translocase subunit SecE
MAQLRDGSIYFHIELFSHFQISYMNKVSNYIRDSYKELMEKVTWPNWQQLQQSTMIVLVATLLITGLVWVMDFIAAGSLNFIYKLF